MNNRRAKQEKGKAISFAKLPVKQPKFVRMCVCIYVYVINLEVRRVMS